MKVDLKQIERPLDLLNNLKGQEVLIILSDDKELSGELITFDIHINIVLKVANELKFIRGERIKIIS